MLTCGFWCNQIRDQYLYGPATERKKMYILKTIGMTFVYISINLSFVNPPPLRYYPYDWSIVKHQDTHMCQKKSAIMSRLFDELHSNITLCYRAISIWRSQYECYTTSRPGSILLTYIADICAYTTNKQHILQRHLLKLYVKIMITCRVRFVSINVYYLEMNNIH